METGKPPVARRVVGKSSPKANPRTAVKSQAKPPLDHSSDHEMNPEKWSRESSKSMLQKLFAWPVRAWRIYLSFRARVQDAYGRDSDYGKLVQEVARDAKRRKVESGTGAAAAPHLQQASKMMKTMEEISISTSFSGVDTPASSFLALGAGLCEILDVPVEHAPKPRNQFAIEWLPASQKVLQKHPHAPECLFSDIGDFWADALRSKLQSILDQKKVDEILLPLVKNGQGVTNRAFCLNHQKFCEAGCCVCRLAGVPIC